MTPQKYLIHWNGKLYEGMIYRPGGSIQTKETYMFTHALYWTSDTYTTKQHIEDWGGHTYGEPGWPLDHTNKRYVFTKTLLIMRQL